MKKLAIWVMMSFWILYVLVPIFYMIHFGKYPQSIKNMGMVPETYMTKVAVIITIVLLLSSLSIYFMPIGNKPLMGTISCSTKYYFVAIGIEFIFAINAGVLNYYNVLTGATSSTLYSYFNMFFNPRILFLVFLFCKKDRRNVLSLLVAYLLLSILMHSRAGALQLGIYLVGFILATGVNLKNIKNRVIEINQQYRKKIKVLIIMLMIVAPLIYEFSTTTRGSLAFDASHSIVETIAARCSCLDEAGLALYAIEINRYSKEIFDEKYGILNQICCIIDSSIPGDLFGGDIDPNQYYKAIVGYMSKEDATKSYISVNLTFPIYMVLKYGYIGGIIFSSLLIVLFYLLIIKINNPIWQIPLLLTLMNELLVYFDWVMVWREFLRIFLTVGTFLLITEYLKVKKYRIKIMGT